MANIHSYIYFIYLKVIDIIRIIFVLISYLCKEFGAEYGFLPYNGEKGIR